MITYNGKFVKHGAKWVTAGQSDPYNPLGLPPYTIRLQYADGVTPTFSKGTGAQVSASPNVWDLTYNSTSWDSLLFGHDQLLSVLGANTAGVMSSVTGMSKMFSGCSSLTTVSLFDTSSVQFMNAMFSGCSSLTTVPLFDTSRATTMAFMFMNCDSLTSVPLFDTSSVTGMLYMFSGCSSLTTVPLFNTSSIVEMDYMFYNCTAVESGALALYTQASTQENPPTSYNDCFTNCGVNTGTGRAELAQIPTSWGGTAS